MTKALTGSLKNPAAFWQLQRYVERNQSLLQFRRKRDVATGTMGALP